MTVLSLLILWAYGGLLLLLAPTACVLQVVFLPSKYVFVCGGGIVQPRVLSFLCFSSLLPPVYSLPNLSGLWQFSQVSLKSVDCICLLVAWKVDSENSIQLFPLSFGVRLISRGEGKSCVVSVIMDKKSSFTKVI